jgi:hypothetical protein
MEKLKLTPNQPEVIALAFTKGKPAPQSKFSGPQVMYTLDDGRLWFADLEAAEKVDALSLGKGEPCEVTMCVDRAKNKSYEVRYIDGATAKTATATHPSPAPQAVQSQRNGTPPEVGPLQQQSSAPSPHTTGGKLMACFLVAVDSLLEVEAYATAKGMNIQFNAEDVRAVANTMFIQNSKDGR